MDSVQDYIKKLTSKYYEMQSIWLIGSRANDASRPDSDWDLLAFANSETLNQLKGDVEFKCEGIDLFIVYDGNNFEHPWDIPSRGGKPKSGTLRNWKWRKLSCNKAQYESSGEIIIEDIDSGAYSPTKRVLKAEKIWPAPQPGLGCSRCSM